MEKSCYRKENIRLPKCLCYSKGLQSEQQKKERRRGKKIYWGWRKKRVKNFMKKFLYLEFQIPLRFFPQITITLRAKKNRYEGKFNLLIATLELCLQQKKNYTVREKKSSNQKWEKFAIFFILFYFVVSDLCGCIWSNECEKKNSLIGNRLQHRFYKNHNL